jgi:hypothetical protein
MISMRKQDSMATALLFYSVTGFMSCSNDYVTPGNQPVSTSLFQGGSRKVMYFRDKNHDETADFAICKIIFNSNGTTGLLMLQKG